VSPTRTGEAIHASVDDRGHACSDGRRRWIERIYRLQGIPDDGWEVHACKEQAVVGGLKGGGFGLWVSPCHARDRY